MSVSAGRMLDGPLGRGLLGPFQLPQYASGRAGFPVKDATLARMDQLMGINGKAVIAWIHFHPSFEEFSLRRYGLMPWLVFAAILTPAMADKLDRAKEFLLATVIATLLASCIATIFPALGPWVGYHFHPYWNQAWEAREIHALRLPRVFTGNPDYTCGLITFPSFHVALAVLGVFALWPFRWFRLPSIVVAAFIAIATVTSGWHYASDGIGGMLVAFLAIAASRKITLPRTSAAGSGPPNTDIRLMAVSDELVNTTSVSDDKVSTGVDA